MDMVSFVKLTTLGPLQIVGFYFFGLLCMWYLYKAGTYLYKKRDEGRFTFWHYCYAHPIWLAGHILNVFLNYTFFSLLFGELPPDGPTISSRIHYYLINDRWKKGYKKFVTLKLADKLNSVDPNHVG